VNVALAEWRSINAQIQEIEAEYRQMSQKAVADVGSSYDDLISKLAGAKPVKDPFETSQDFQRRLSKYEEQMKQIETRRLSEAASVRNDYETAMSKAAGPYKERQALIERGYYPIKDRSALEWKYYDADQSALWMTLGGTLLLCRVPAVEARVANASMDLLRMETRVRFSPSAAEPYGYLVGHPAFSGQITCETMNDRFVTELTSLLKTDDLVAFRRQADFAIGLGAELVFKIKCGGYLPVFDGLVTVSKTAVSFTSPAMRDLMIFRGFAVSPDKILELSNHPQQRCVHMKVAIENEKRHKEDKMDFTFCNPGVEAGVRLQGHKDVEFVECNGCDDSMNVLFTLLEYVRGKMWASR